MKEYIVPVDDKGNVNLIENELHLQQLIRCENCKHHRKDTCSAGAGMAFPPPGDWFCADGESKD